MRAATVPAAAARRQAAQPEPSHASALLRLAWPIAVAQLSQMAMALTDSILLGGLGHAALAAGGLSAGLFFTVIIVLQSVLGAAGVGIAQALGRDSREVPPAGVEGRIGRITATALLLGLTLSLPVIPLLGEAGWLLRRLGEPAALVRDAGAYMDVLRWGAPPALAGLGLLRAVLPAIGGANLLLRVMPVMALLNGLLNAGLIHGLWGLPRLGLLGSALASALTLWITPAVLTVAILCRPRLRAMLRPLRPDVAECLPLLRLGVPIGVTVAAEVALFQVAGLQAGLLGAASLAAHQIALNVAGISFMVPLALSQAANVRVGFWTGADRPRQARRSGLTAMALSVLFTGTVSLLLLALPRVIAAAYLDPARGSDRAAFSLAVILLGIVALFQVADGVQTVALGALRGLGDTAMPMLLATIGYWLIGFPLGTLAAFRLHLGVAGLWSGLACALLSVALMTGLRFLRRTRPTPGARGRR